MSDNILLMTDSYKHSHPYQYPSDTRYLHFYLESRGVSDSDMPKYTKFFGLQYYIKKYLSQPINQDMLAQAKEILGLHGLPFYEAGFRKIIDKYDGYLPVRIRAVPEGSIVATKNVLMTIESTDDELFWLPGFLETLLLKVWYPTTVATLSRNIRSIITEYMSKTSDNSENINFMLHDFGYRGVSSEESAAIGGAAHLTNFLGTDTLASIVFAQKYYNEKMPGYSIPASEHSTITAWGVGSACEKQAFENMVDKFGDDFSLYACVSDSWDFKQAIKSWTDMYEYIISKNAKLVIRPDSGDALDNIAYAVDELATVFGYDINSKGYKVLKNVSLIQGDGVNIGLIKEILSMLESKGFSAENVAFGMGGALLQGNFESSINRDSYKFAIKCSAIIKGDKLENVYKDPATDSTKRSKRGRLDLIKDKNGDYKSVVLGDNYQLNEYHADSEFITYYENGRILTNQSLSEIRQRDGIL